MSDQWPFMVLAEIGVGLVLSPANTDALNRGPSSRYGEATGITQTVRNFGSSLGLSLLGTVLILENKANLESTLGAEGLPESQADQVAEAVTEAGGGNEAAFAEAAGRPGADDEEPGSLSAAEAVALQQDDPVGAFGKVQRADVVVVEHPERARAEDAADRVPAAPTAFFFFVTAVAAPAGATDASNMEADARRSQEAGAAGRDPPAAGQLAVEVVEEAREGGSCLDTARPARGRIVIA